MLGTAPDGLYYVSPMPFGSESSSDKPTGFAGMLASIKKSPMPFGSESSSDSALKGADRDAKVIVTNAFRQRVLFGQCGKCRTCIGRAEVTNAFRQRVLFGRLHL